MRRPNLLLALCLLAGLPALAPAMQATPEGPTQRTAPAGPRRAEAPPPPSAERRLPQPGEPAAQRPDTRRGDRGDDRPGDRHADRRGDDRPGDRPGDRRLDDRTGTRPGDHRVDERHRPPRPEPVPAPHGRRDPTPRPGDAHRWWDGAHGHARYYPRPGYAVRSLPSHARVVIWGGARYNYFDGVWYAPGPLGFAVVRPPIGIVVHDLPSFRTSLVIGGLPYYYVNGVYYRERHEGDYEVVPTPVDAGTGAPEAGPDKLYVYPARGQTAQQQASDEYECHRWAVGQTGFDPTAAAVGQPVGDAARRLDYQRAITACLEGRGYTVR